MANRRLAPQHRQVAAERLRPHRRPARDPDGDPLHLACVAKLEGGGQPLVGVDVAEHGLVETIEHQLNLSGDCRERVVDGTAEVVWRRLIREPDQHAAVGSLGHVACCRPALPDAGFAEEHDDSVREAREVAGLRVQVTREVTARIPEKAAALQLGWFVAR